MSAQMSPLHLALIIIFLFLFVFFFLLQALAALVDGHVAIASRPDPRSQRPNAPHARLWLQRADLLVAAVHTQLGVAPPRAALSILLTGHGVSQDPAAVWRTWQRLTEERAVYGPDRPWPDVVCYQAALRALFACRDIDGAWRVRAFVCLLIPLGRIA